MKNIFMVVALLSAVAVHGQVSEKKFYLRLGAGYAFSNGGQISFGGITLQGSSTDNGTTTANKLKKGSLGAGVTTYFSAGYKINKRLAAEIGVMYGAAPTEYRYERTHTGGGSAHDHHINETKAVSPVYVMPGLGLRQPLSRSFLLFTRAALVLPVSGRTEYIHTQTSGPAGAAITSVSTEKITHRFGLGFSGSLGFQYNISRSFGVWIEGTSLNLNRWAKRSQRTSYTENGVDALASLEGYQRQTEYLYDPVYGTPTTEPAQVPTFAAPYSHLGVMLGISAMF